MKNVRLWLGGLLMLGAIYATAEVTKKTISDTKIWTKNFEVNANALFDLKSRESDINITTWNENRVEVKVTLTVEAFDQEEIDKLFEAFTPTFAGSATRVSVTNPACVQNQIVTNNRMRLKINNQIIKVKDYHFQYDIKMPATNHLNLKNRFGKVQLGSHSGEVDLELYECRVSGAQLNAAKTQASLKFSDGSLGASKSLSLSTYESDVILTESHLLDLNAKFSEITFAEVHTATINAYESEIDLGRTHTVALKQSFGKLIIAEAKTLQMTTYELECTVGRVDNLEVPSTKFSKIICGQTQNVSIGEAYENQMTFGELENLEMEARFSKVDVGKLKKNLAATGYELQLVVAEVSPDFSRLSLDGKFSNAHFKLKDVTGYRLQAKLSYGNMELPSEALAGLSVDKKGNNVTISGKTTGYSGPASITVTGYEMDVKLSYL